MKKGQLGSEGLLLLAAIIWGFAFVAQRVGMRYVGPFTFNAVRFALGSLALVPFAAVATRRRRAGGADDGDGWKRTALIGGAISGTVIFLGASFQQTGLVYTTAGKAGFITSLYVVFVPLLGLLTGQSTGRWTWWGALLAAVGLYLLTVKGWVGIALGDGLVLIGAIFWAAHVLTVGKLSGRIAPIRLAISQFVVLKPLRTMPKIINIKSTTPGPNTSKVHNGEFPFQ